jgi:hypothetical protein
MGSQVINPLDYGTKAENCRIVEITPKLADQWLVRNTMNRPLNETIVTRYTVAMDKELWELNGEAIVFDDAGRLIQGQHRLTAVSRSGKPIKSYVVFNVAAKNAFSTFDTGRKRSASDVLSIDGNVDTNKLAAIATKIIQWRKGYLPGVGCNIGYTPQNCEVLEFVRKNPSIADSIKISTSLRKLANPSLMGLLHYLCNRIDVDKCESFFTRLDTGEMLGAANPIYTLRERLFQSKAANKDSSRSISVRLKLTIYEEAIAIVKAWNTFMQGREMKLIKFVSGEKFPEVYGDVLFGIDKRKQ